MRGSPSLPFLRNIYFLVTVLILISSFAGCAAGSCLSYGHSCWGAHGKRSGSESDPVGRRMIPSNLGDRWLFSQMIKRRFTQSPLGARLHPRVLPEFWIPPESKQGYIMENFSEDMNTRDSLTDESKIQEGISPEVLFAPRRKDYNIDDDPAIKIGLYRILKNLDDNLE